MKEIIDGSRKLDGDIKVTCKYEQKDGSVKIRVWETKKEVVIARIISIVNDYSRKGYKLTLRQLHYQLVTRNWIINHDRCYKKLGEILDDCRYAGLIDWESIEDRGRVPHLPYHADDVSDALDDLKGYYRVDRQRGQDHHVELWTEKDALSGILARVTEKYHIQLVVNKGYTSSSAIYQAYKRIKGAMKDGKKVTILYFGDHDPSGLDMIRDIRSRLLLFLAKGKDRNHFIEGIREWWEDNYYTLYSLIENEMTEAPLQKLLDGEYPELDEEFDTARIKFFLHDTGKFTVLPVGLTMEQIEEYDLPENPTKLTDTRAAKYIEKFGRICWEVDALDPETLIQIVEDNVQQIIDIPLYESVLEEEEKDRQQIQDIIDNLDE